MEAMMDFLNVNLIVHSEDGNETISMRQAIYILERSVVPDQCTPECTPCHFTEVFDREISPSTVEAILAYNFDITDRPHAGGEIPLPNGNMFPAGLFWEVLVRSGWSNPAIESYVRDRWGWSVTPAEIRWMCTIYEEQLPRDARGVPMLPKKIIRPLRDGHHMRSLPTSPRVETNGEPGGLLSALPPPLYASAPQQDGVATRHPSEVVAVNNHLPPFYPAGATPTPPTYDQANPNGSPQLLSYLQVERATWMEDFRNGRLQLPDYGDIAGRRSSLPGRIQLIARTGRDTIQVGAFNARRTFRKARSTDDFGVQIPFRMVNDTMGTTEHGVSPIDNISSALTPKRHPPTPSLGLCRSVDFDDDDIPPLSLSSPEGSTHDEPSLADYESVPEEVPEQVHTVYGFTREDVIRYFDRFLKRLIDGDRQNRRDNAILPQQFPLPVDGDEEVPDNTDGNQAEVPPQENNGVDPNVETVDPPQVTASDPDELGSALAYADLTDEELNTFLNDPGSNIPVQPILRPLPSTPETQQQIPEAAVAVPAPVPAPARPLPALETRNPRQILNHVRYDNMIRARFRMAVTQMQQMRDIVRDIERRIYGSEPARNRYMASAETSGWMLTEEERANMTSFADEVEEMAEDFEARVRYINE